MPEEKQRRVDSRCKECGNDETFYILEAGYVAMRKGGPLKKHFPTLSEEKIVQLASSICPACQKKAKDRNAGA